MGLDTFVGLVCSDITAWTDLDQAGPLYPGRDDDSSFYVHSGRRRLLSVLATWAARSCALCAFIFGRP